MRQMPVLATAQPERLVGCEAEVDCIAVGTYPCRPPGACGAAGAHAGAAARVTGEDSVDPFRILIVRSFNKTAEPPGDAQNHALSRAHGAPRARRDVAPLGGSRRGERLRLDARARVRRGAQRRGAVRRLAAAQVPDRRPRCGATAGPAGYA